MLKWWFIFSFGCSSCLGLEISIMWFSTSWPNVQRVAALLCAACRVIYRHSLFLFTTASCWCWGFSCQGCLVAEPLNTILSSCTPSAYTIQRYSITLCDDIQRLPWCTLPLQLAHSNSEIMGEFNWSSVHKKFCLSNTLLVCQFSFEADNDIMHSRLAIVCFCLGWWLLTQWVLVTPVFKLRIHRS